MQKIILSHPRSGNHLMRFFVELITEKPTYGLSHKDTEIYKNKFDMYVPFNITRKQDANKTKQKQDEYQKIHKIDEICCKKEKPNNLIFILRNPRELISRILRARISNKIENVKAFSRYLKNIDYFLEFEGTKKYFFMRI